MVLVDHTNIESKVEPFLSGKITNNKDVIFHDNPISMLTWNRLDLAFKLTYLENKNKNVKYAQEIYHQDIKAQTLNKFIEYGNEDKKNSFLSYQSSFEDTFSSIAEKGFDSNETIIPCSKNTTLLNGAHRVSSCIFLNEGFATVNTDLDDMIIDYNYYYQRDVPIDVIEKSVNTFIEYANDVYLAFLWPSGRQERDTSENFFSNVVYKKELKLSHKGAKNLLIELYKHMEWAGKPSNNFDGIDQKLIECFPTMSEVKVIAFQADSLDDVRLIKEKVRNVHKIGFSSIHITDTKEEAIRISKLIFNENGVHFLNYANPYKFFKLHNELSIFKGFCHDHDLLLKDLVVDGSFILNLYGLRQSSDIDYISDLEINVDYKGDVEIESHNDQVKYHTANKQDLIYDHHYYFEYLGIKFISFNTLYDMKKQRAETKDVNDCKIMSSYISGNQLLTLISKLNQKLLYVKIKAKKNIRESMFTLLHYTKLYSFVRSIYRKYKS